MIFEVYAKIADIPYVSSILQFTKNSINIKSVNEHF